MAAVLGGFKKQTLTLSCTNTADMLLASKQPFNTHITLLFVQL